MTVRVPLSDGQYALVDEADHHLVAGRSWRSRQRMKTAGHYAVASGRIGEPANLYMHRLILGAAAGQYVDHVNRDCLDNRRANLRFATLADNARNSESRLRPNKHGYRGVMSEAGRSGFRATIRVEGKTRNLTRRLTAEDAARDYDAAARQHFGAFAVLNFPEASA